MSLKALFLGAALAAAAPNFAAAGGTAPGKPETAQGKVMLAGLDLSTSVGIAQAHERLTRMAERLCRKFRDGSSAGDWATYVDCVHDSVASALERIPVISVASN
jgi:UrcA family protein